MRINLRRLVFGCLLLLFNDDSTHVNTQLHLSSAEMAISSFNGEPWLGGQLHLGSAEMTISSFTPDLTESLYPHIQPIKHSSF